MLKFEHASERFYPHRNFDCDIPDGVAGDSGADEYIA